MVICQRVGLGAGVNNFSPYTAACREMSLRAVDLRRRKEPANLQPLVYMKLKFSVIKFLFCAKKLRHYINYSVMQKSFEQ
jgi:hypothetical protein